MGSASSTLKEFQQNQQRQYQQQQQQQQQQHAAQQHHQQQKHQHQLQHDDYSLQSEEDVQNKVINNTMTKTQIMNNSNNNNNNNNNNNKIDYSNDNNSNDIIIVKDNAITSTKKNGIKIENTNTFPVNNVKVKESMKQEKDKHKFIVSNNNSITTSNDDNNDNNNNNNTMQNDNMVVVQVVPQNETVVVHEEQITTITKTTTDLNMNDDSKTHNMVNDKSNNTKNKDDEVWKESYPVRFIFPASAKVENDIVDSQHNTRSYSNEKALYILEQLDMYLKKNEKYILELHNQDEYELSNDINGHLKTSGTNGVRSVLGDRYEIFIHTDNNGKKVNGFHNIIKRVFFSTNDNNENDNNNKNKQKYKFHSIEEVKHIILLYCQYQAKQDIRIQGDYIYENFSILISYSKWKNSMKQQIPHIDFTYPEYQFILSISNNNPTTLCYQHIYNIQTISDLIKYSWTDIPKSLYNVMKNNDTIQYLIQQFGSLLYYPNRITCITNTTVPRGTLTSIPGSRIHAGPSVPLPTNPKSQAKYRSVLFFTGRPKDDMTINKSGYNSYDQWTASALCCEIARIVWTKTTSDDITSRIYILKQIINIIQQDKHYNIYNNINENSYLKMFLKRYFTNSGRNSNKNNNINNNEEFIIEFAKIINDLDDIVTNDQLQHFTKNTNNSTKKNNNNNNNGKKRKSSSSTKDNNDDNEDNNNQTIDDNNSNNERDYDNNNNNTDEEQEAAAAKSLSLLKRQRQSI